MKTSVYDPMIDSAIFILTWASLSFYPGTLKRTSVDILIDKLRRNIVFDSDLSGQQIKNLHAISNKTTNLNSARHLTPNLDVTVEFPNEVQLSNNFCQDGFVSFQEVLWILDYPYTNPDLLKKITKLTDSIDEQMDVKLSLAA